MAKYMVNFIPVNRSTFVEEGETIAEAARKANVYIKNLCGGQGICGQCRVQILSGNVKLEEKAKAFFSKEELEKGYVLACQARIYDNVEVLIPPESRMEGAKILTGEMIKATEIELLPLVKKTFLELPHPTLEDNVSDFKRLNRELRKKTGWHDYEISLSSLRKLNSTLRESDFKITASIAKQRSGYRIINIENGNTINVHYGIALDIGTTTVVAQLVEMNTGRVLGVTGMPNPQASYGEDVISRIIFACDKKNGLDELHKVIIDAINQLIETLTKEKDIPSEDIIALVAAGNTTMSHLFLKLMPCTIRLDPYVPVADTYPQVFAKELNIEINPEAIVETLPSVASYVGGDIVAGVIACGISERPEITALIDIGTNGEIVIGNNEWLVCCSASAGPAFEGGGTRCGMRATRGAINELTISDGKVSYKTIGNAKPIGLCGSGLIDCMYELVKNKIIRPDGKFERDLKDERFSIVDDIPQYTLVPAEESGTKEPIVITEADIDNLMKSKGAIFAAMKSLVDYIGITFDQIEKLYVAGGFGNYLNIEKAIGIGLLPDMPRDRIEFVGNTSLAGARICLLSEKAFEKAFVISRAMTNIELSVYQPFMDEFVAALFLPHTNKELFPSVKY